MTTEKITRNQIEIAVLRGGEVLIADARSALDLLMTVQYETGCSRLVLPKSAVAEDFFELRTGLAGEVLQKFVNYHAKLAVVGDFSGYESKSLRDFIGESNRGRDIFFLPTEEAAVERLSLA